MKKQIITTAGRIWRVLGDKGRMDIAQLPRSLKEKSVIVYQALGWLAREDKIRYVKRSGKVYVSLTPAEVGVHQLVAV